MFSTEVLVGWVARVWEPLASRRNLWRVILGVVALPVNLGVAVYTGVLLGVLPFRPFWHTWLLPALLPASAPGHEPRSDGSNEAPASPGWAMGSTWGVALIAPGLSLIRV